ncbi:MAG: sigma 54-interacting transcriptional regulator [Verrucomicrobia bacterium]|nr:sigma 54-interacting transcriptional regulator [Verrucomicrobiota bacterium]
MNGTAKYTIDSNRAINLLLELSHERSLESLLNKLIDAIINGTNEVVCAQIWLLEKGDNCTACAHSHRCTDHSQCLHLHIGKVRSSIYVSNRDQLINDPNSRIPLGIGLLGESTQSGQQNYIPDWKKHPSCIEGFEWIKEKNVMGLASTPIVFRGKVLGAVLGFTTHKLEEAGKPWGRIFADFIGGAIFNARAIEEILHLKSQLELQNEYLKELVVETKAFGHLVGQSAALQRIISQIELVAPTDASVLILGETGTGKELVAYEIHERSSRKNGPMVRVNCASIPKELFESEFFGHVKGAFTGAVKDRPGRFETAEGGTLFLDEIGEIPLDMQGKLLRVLQEKRYERVGDDKTRTANVRIIAATNRDLKDAVDAKQFREDLYYRINVFPIQVAPLRERKDDIPLLVKHFIDLSVKELRCNSPKLTRSALATLQNYDWPGNIRELRNVVERAVILSRGGNLHFNIPIDTRSAGIAVHFPSANTSADTQEPDYLTEEEMNQRQKENTFKVLQKTNWKIKGADGAAALLGIKPTTLLSRIKKMGLQRPHK